MILNSIVNRQILLNDLFFSNNKRRFESFDNEDYELHGFGIKDI